MMRAVSTRVAYLAFVVLSFCFVEVLVCGVFPTKVFFDRYQSTRLWVVAVDDHRPVYYVRGERRVALQCVWRPFRRVDSLFLTNLPVANCHRLCLRQHVFYCEGVATRDDDRDRSLYPPWFRRQLRVFSGGEHLGDWFVEWVDFCCAGRPFGGATRFWVVIAVFAGVGSPRDRCLQFDACCFRRTVPRCNYSEVCARGSFLFCQLGRLVASVGIKGPAALSLGVFVVSSFEYVPY